MVPHLLDAFLSGSNRSWIVSKSVIGHNYGLVACPIIHTDQHVEEFPPPFAATEEAPVEHYPI